MSLSLQLGAGCRERLVLFLGLLLPMAIPVAGQAFRSQIAPVAPGCYVHTSFGRFGGVTYPSNGLIISTSAGAVLIDTGWDVPQTRQIVRWIRRTLHQPVTLCIVSHSHADRMAGMGWLRNRGVRVVSTALTAATARAAGKLPPAGSLPADTTMHIGGQTIRTYFAGAGHSADNIVVWLPTQQLLFGGCLIKSTGAMGLGNIADAVLPDWPGTIQRVADTFPDATIIVPGHDQWGDRSSLTHTLNLLKMRPKQP